MPIDTRHLHVQKTDQWQVASGRCDKRGQRVDEIFTLPINLDRVSDTGLAKQQPHQVDVIVIVIDREDDTALMAMCFHGVRIDSGSAKWVLKTPNFMPGRVR